MIDRTGVPEILLNSIHAINRYHASTKHHYNVFSWLLLIPRTLRISAPGWTNPDY
jgi:hypothetical protein